MGKVITVDVLIKDIVEPQDDRVDVMEAVANGNFDIVTIKEVVA